MTLPLRQIKARKSIPKVRTKPRRTKAIKCRPHVNWVLDKWQCIAAGKVSKVTGKPHVCEGRLDPHHSPTRGAGGGDNNVSPCCRWLHSRLDSPGHSEKSVEAEYGISFRDTGASLWEGSPYRYEYERKQHTQSEPRRASTTATEGTK